MSHDIDGGEARGGVGPPQHVVSAELGDHTGVRRQTHAAHGSQAHRHAVTSAAFFGVEVQTKMSISKI